MDTPACYAAALERHLIVAASEEAALQLAAAQPDSVDALVVFDPSGADVLRYSLRLNHTDVPSPSNLIDLFDVSPGIMPTPGNMLWCACARGG